MHKNTARTVFMVMGQISAKKGGQTRVLLDRASLFVRNGYTVKVLTLTWDINLPNIVAELKALGRVDSRVEFIDAHDFYVINQSEKGTSYFLSFFQNQTKLYETGYNIDLSKFESDQQASYFKDGSLCKIKCWKEKKESSLELNWILEPDEEQISYTVSYPYHDSRLCFRQVVDSSSGNVLVGMHWGLDGNLKIKRNLLDPNRIIVFDEFGSEIKFDSDEGFLAFLIEFACKQEEVKPFVIIDGFHWSDVARHVEKHIADVILVSHNSHLELPNKGNKPIPAVYDKKFYHRVFKEWEKYAALIILTEEQREDILKDYPDIKNIFVIPNCIPNSRIPEQLNLVKKNECKVVCVTRLSFEKNICDLIYAFLQVVTQRKDAVLEVYGDGEDKESLLRIVKRLKLENNVFLKGYALDVNKVYQSALVSVLTSKSEGHPLALLESMVNGVPCVSFACKYGPKESVSDGEDGFLLTPGDCKGLADRLVYALNHPDEVIQMGKRGKTKVSAVFGQEAYLEKWERVMDCLYSPELVQTTYSCRQMPRV